MQRAPTAFSKCQGKSSALTRARLSLPARRRLWALPTSSGTLGLVGAKKPPNLELLTAALKPCNRKKILPQIVLGFTPSNDILTASISGMALLFSPWSSINALPQNSYEPAGLLHSPGCELLPAFPRGANAHGLGWLCPAWPQTSISDHSNKDNLLAEARC